MRSPTPWGLVLALLATVVVTTIVLRLLLGPPIVITSTPFMADATPIPVMCDLTFQFQGSSASERFPAATVESGMHRGRVRAAHIWGHLPGATFQLSCAGTEAPTAGLKAPDGSGHGGLNWRFPI